MSDDGPFAALPAVPSFTLASATVVDGQQMPLPQRSGIFGVPGGEDKSPQLSWSGAPTGAKSYVLTMFDSDAATGSGFWHWVVKDIPVTTTSLPLDAGAPDSAAMPSRAVTLPGDAGMHRYIGAAPPPGDAPHHYWLTVWAIAEASVSVRPSASAALLINVATPHVLARATIGPIASR